MHEAAIAEALCRMVSQQFAGRAGRITKVTVVAGNLCGIVPEQLEKWFTEFSRGGPARDAKIDVIARSARLVCCSCGAASDYSPGSPVPLACRACDGRIVLEGGREMYLDSMEIEE